VGPYYTEEEQRFRVEVRKWLAKNVDDAVRVGRGEPEPGKEERWVAAQREWDCRLYEGGYAGLAWPKEYGGRGATVLEQVVFAEEAARAGAPNGLNHLGRNLVGPPIIRHGTEAQKRRFLPPMLKGEEVWCQGFSEPNAGSDLASLQTSAVLDGDDYVVNGQKIWTSGAHHSDWMMLLARTDPAAPKHKGITAFLVDLRTPGIEVRPIRQLSGSSGFNEDFFDNARIPKENVLGPLNEGWDVAMTTLGHERSTLNAGRHLTNIQHLRKAVERFGEPLRQGTPNSVLLQEKLGRAYAASRALGYLQKRYVSKWATGARPGPESSLLRLMWALSYQQAAGFALDLIGPKAQIPYGPDAVEGGDWLYIFYEARSRTIAAGTAEIQKNVIAERVLGMPR
jgi:alkylation response protein AidB-like acyl-CoA dehydrogenase